MSKNANYIYPILVMSNDINLGEGWERGRIIKNISSKGQNRNNLNCYKNCEVLQTYEDSVRK
jgi:hypothetical protein